MAEQQQIKLPVQQEETKPYLRQKVLGRWDDMDADTRTTLSRAIVQDIANLAAYRRSSTVMAYIGFGSELQTDEFVPHNLDQGKTLLLPRVKARNNFATSSLLPNKPPNAYAP